MNTITYLLRELVNALQGPKLTGDMPTLSRVAFAIREADEATKNSTVVTLADVHRERQRQDDKWGPVQDHPSFLPVEEYEARFGKDTTTPVDVNIANHYGVLTADEAKANCDARFKHGVGSYADILVEEVCEALAEYSDLNEEKLEVELIQVAAVAVKWVENIRANRKKRGLTLNVEALMGTSKGPSTGVSEATK